MEWDFSGRARPARAKSVIMQIWKATKRTFQHIEWPTLIGLWGFGLLATTSLAQGYPLIFVIVLATIGIFFSLLAAYNSYRQKSTILVDKYEEKFFERMKPERRLAAQYLLGKRKESGELEEILDFFEAPIAKKTISGEIAEDQVYSYFYHWIRLYWQAAQDYIKEYRQDEPCAWGSLKILYDIISNLEKIERRKDTGGKCSD